VVESAFEFITSFDANLYGMLPEVGRHGFLAQLSGQAVRRLMRRRVVGLLWR
jgi:hypothetical protein